MPIGVNRDGKIVGGPAHNPVPEPRKMEQAEGEADSRRAARLTALDTILRTYTARELEVAREAIRTFPALTGKPWAIKAVREMLTAGPMKYDERTARDLVDAVAQADGAYEHATTPPNPDPPPLSWQCPSCEHHCIAEGSHPAYGGPEKICSKCGTARPLPSRRVLGRGLAEIEEAARQFGTIRETADGFENVLLPPSPFPPRDLHAETVALALDKPVEEVTPQHGDGTRTFVEPAQPVHVEGEPITQQRQEDEEAKAQAAAIQYGRTGFNIPVIKETYSLRWAESRIAALTQQAVDRFLGTGVARTQTLRGVLRFLTQEDLATVLAECCVAMDDEHLTQSARMMGPDDLQSLNFATADEIAARMLDAGVGAASDFPIRPLAPHEHAEPVDFSENGNPLLEKDVQYALGVIERDSNFLPGEAKLAEEIERATGWNSVYAGEVAGEAWARYSREPESEPEPKQHEEGSEK